MSLRAGLQDWEIYWTVGKIVGLTCEICSSTSLSHVTRSKMTAPSSFAVWGCVSGFRPSAEGRSGMSHLQSWILSQVDAPHFFFFATVMFRDHDFYVETRHGTFSWPVQSSVWAGSVREILGYTILTNMWEKDYEERKKQGCEAVFINKGRNLESIFLLDQYLLKRKGDRLRMKKWH